ncbi:MAG: endonuclease Q family protein [Patescibacteria group bacterium]|mgnify:CR=1 FL=1
MEKILDLHIHSRYSRACSADLELPKIAQACEQKGIDIVSTGDFTHPAWIKHIKENLVEENQGIYKLKDNSSQTRFILGTEISCIYKHKDATRRVHLLILAPSIEAVEKFNAILTAKGVNIRSDGRPIMGLSAKTVLQIILDIDPGFMMIPAHIWTPWFAVFGSKSGYNTLEECFEELTPHIRAVETGLSSDPTMNHRLSALDNITLVSNSDAHSLNNLGREANVFNLEENFTYDDILQVLKTGDREKFLYTIEFYPEEGKYYHDGHAACEIVLSPKETRAKKFLCPKCKKPVTVGVLHRVEDLTDRQYEKVFQTNFIPHKYIVPLKEIIAKVFHIGPTSKKVLKEYEMMLKNIRNEFYILLKASDDEIRNNISDKNILTAIKNMRAGKVKVQPGYDGIFGSVDVI